LLPDADSDPREPKRRAVELWKTATELARTVGQRRLKQKLSSLGGPAAQFLLTIPAADQAEMMRRGGRSITPVARVRGPREYLDAGGTFAEEAVRVWELLRQAGGEEARISEGEERMAIPEGGKRLAIPEGEEWFESFIALRWASGGSDAAHAFSCGVQRSIRDEARSLGRSGGAWTEEVVFGPCDEARRWEEVARLTAEGVAALRAEASLLSLGGEGGAGGEAG
jgi:hypothetical protein